MDGYTEETGVTSGAHKKQQVITGLRWCCLRDQNQAVVIHLLSYQCNLPPPVLVRVTTHHLQHQCRRPQLNHLCPLCKTCKASRIHVLLHQLLQHEVDESLDPCQLCGPLVYETLLRINGQLVWDIIKGKWTWQSISLFSLLLIWIGLWLGDDYFIFFIFHSFFCKKGRCNNICFNYHFRPSFITDIAMATVQTMLSGFHL